MKISFCHKCKKREAKVRIVKDGYLVKCPCGNSGINVKENIYSAIFSWSSGYQKVDKS